MQYRNDRNDRPVSLLGFGCMRWQRSGLGIELAAAEEQVMRAIELGVNYFDTAYIYPGSEDALGRILERNDVRGRVSIATKLPQYLIKGRGAIDRYFDEQLRRLRTDHVDYYLMHMLTDVTAWEKLVSLGIEDWIADKKASGQVRNIGFSFHGNTEMFLKVLAAYDWDFCQIQYNYLDENAQAGRVGLLAAAERGIPVVVMEPLRGGKLVDLLPKEASEAIAASTCGWSPAELAFRWLYNQPQVTCVLSGMNSVSMVEENCRVASEAKVGEFGTDDLALVERVKTAIAARIKIGCTGCGYCMPCPAGVQIPKCFDLYNKMHMFGNADEAKSLYIASVGGIVTNSDPGFASHCVACGTCLEKCPQHIEITEFLKKVTAEMEGPDLLERLAEVRRLFKTEPA